MKYVGLVQNIYQALLNTYREDIGLVKLKELELFYLATQRTYDLLGIKIGYDAKKNLIVERKGQVEVIDRGYAHLVNAMVLGQVHRRSGLEV